MVAAFLQFNRGGAVEAALPALLFSDLGETLRGLVFRTFTTCMPFTIASAADFGPATAAFPVFAAAVRTARGVQVDIRGFDPFATSSCGTVDAVLGSVLLVLLIPFLLELCIKELLDVFQRNVVLSTAFGRHMLRVSNGQREYSPQTGVAHAMIAR